VYLLSFIPGYTEKIYDQGREPAFVMLAAFLIAFIVTRTYTRVARVRGWRSGSLIGVHAHHLVFGLILAFTAGALQFIFFPPQAWAVLVLAACFGIGGAMVLDEFALVFHLKDVYWEEEGRKSVDAVVIAALLSGLLLMGVTPLSGLEDVFGVALTLAVVINLFFVIIAGLKGKLYLTIFGLFVPAVAMIGAIRLAEPTSIWAHRYYKRGGKKMKRSLKRYQHYEEVWSPRKHKVWDIIGGKPWYSV
jgi:lysyl-tRNA synthetase class 2